jgi:tetratricopeptide (TPR) repeat protein
MFRSSSIAALARTWLGALALAILLGTAMPAVAQGSLNRQQALQALAHADPTRRLEAMVRLADIGTASDVEAVMPRLADRDPTLQRVALMVVWRLWGRSGDAAIDKLYEQGVSLMQSGDLPKAVQVFTDIISRLPAFAEAWNKRATLYYMLDQYELSMKDCDEVLKRVPKHFGALSGYAQMLVERGQLERALEYLERAYQVNPGMANAEVMIEDLRRQIEAKRKKSA